MYMHVCMYNNMYVCLDRQTYQLVLFFRSFSLFIVSFLNVVLFVLKCIFAYEYLYIYVHLHILKLAFYNYYC